MSIIQREQKAISNILIYATLLSACATGSNFHTMLAQSARNNELADKVFFYSVLPEAYDEFNVGEEDRAKRCVSDYLINLLKCGNDLDVKSTFTDRERAFMNNKFCSYEEMSDSLEGSMCYAAVDSFIEQRGIIASEVFDRCVVEARDDYEVCGL